MHLEIDMNGENEFPDVVSKERTQIEIVRVRNDRSLVWVILIWTMYLFQIAIAIPAIYYGWINPDGYDWTSHWSIIGNILGSLFAVSWIEKNILNKDDDDGRYH